MEAATEDQGLVSSVLGGQTHEFDELVRRYQRQAVAVAYRLLGNLHDAADVAQDAFLRAYSGLSSLDDPSRFGPWLMRIVSNLALNYRRSRHSGVRRGAVALGEAVESDASRHVFQRDGGSPKDSPGGAETSETQTAIERAIEQLPEKQRLSFVLFCIEGLPQKDVAEIMECSVELVKWNVFQARKALKEILADVV